MIACDEWGGAPNGNSATGAALLSCRQEKRPLTYCCGAGTTRMYGFGVFQPCG